MCAWQKMPTLKVSGIFLVNIGHGRLRHATTLTRTLMFLKDAHVLEMSSMLSMQARPLQLYFCAWLTGSWSSRWPRQPVGTHRLSMHVNSGHEGMSVLCYYKSKIRMLQWIYVSEWAFVRVFMCARVCVCLCAHMQTDSTHRVICPSASEEEGPSMATVIHLHTKSS